MLTLTTALVLLGFFTLYNTSQKVRFSSTLPLEIWVQSHPKEGRVIGLLLLLAGAFLCSFYLGIGSGFFSFLIILMTIGSLVILIAPLQLLNYKTISLVFLLFLIFELN